MKKGYRQGQLVIVFTGAVPRTVGQQSKKKTNHVNLHVLRNEHKQCNFQILSTQTIEHLKLKPIELKMTFSLC